MPGIIVVGAGLSGLLAARMLQERGLEVVVLEQEQRAGGRMATYHHKLASGETAVFDYGAQFFTVRDPRFGSLVEEWQTAGLVEAWCHGFMAVDGRLYEDGYPRYRATNGMAALTQYLGRDIDVQLGSQVNSMILSGNKWQLETTGGKQYTPTALIMTPPVPQSLALLENGQVNLTAPVRQALTQIRYEPCLALLIVLASPSQLPYPGAVHIGEDPLAWLADNQQKGISPQATAVTIHAGPDFSRRHWDSDDGTVSDLLLEAARPWLGPAGVTWWRLCRWPYSRPVNVYPDSCLVAPTAAPLVFAGDAFAGPRVESAVLSGLAAARQII